MLRTLVWLCLIFAAVGALRVSSKASPFSTVDIQASRRVRNMSSAEDVHDALDSTDFAAENKARADIFANAEGTNPLSAFDHIDALFEKYNCTHAYLDVGTNIAVQIRKLYQPHLYPPLNGSVSAIQEFENYFGKGPKCQVCSFGFEPNPRHWDRNDELAKNMRAAGAPVFIFKGAAYTKNDVLEFQIPKKAGRNADWGASLVDGAHKTKMKKVQVHAFDLSKIIHRINHHLVGNRGEEGRPLSSKIVMKLDIEGAEEEVLPHLFKDQSLCIVDRLFIEWHSRFWNKQHMLREAPLKEVGQHHSGWRVKQYLDKQNKALVEVLSQKDTDDCRASVSEIDDETYYQDGIPFDASAMCTAP